jgi:TonB family protein
MTSLSAVFNPNDQNANGRGWIVSLLMHILLIIILFLPMIISQPPPPEQEGLLVNLGLLDEGQGNETPKGTNEKAIPEPSKEPTKVQPMVQPTSVNKPAKAVAQNTVTSNEQNEILVNEAKARQQAEADAQQRAAEEANRQAAFNQTKKSYGDLLGTGSKGNTGKPGSQGDPNGDPNSDILEGISNGSGRVGGGLGSRGVLHEPKITDNSQKTGRVVISVCVDKSGRVIKATYTQKGSTTTDSELQKIARDAALQFKFTKSDIEEQCGTITVDFKLRG